MWVAAGRLFVSGVVASAGGGALLGSGYFSAPVHYARAGGGKKGVLSDIERTECMDVISVIKRLESSGATEKSVDEVCSEIQFNDGSVWEKIVDNSPGLTLWRRPCFGSSYAYLSHSTHDFPVKDYFRFMMDLKGRELWDASSAAVDIVDGENEAIVYCWEVKSPWPFSNRDYVCSRKYQEILSAEKATLYLALSQAITHPACPERYSNAGIVRVERYRSCMALRAISANQCESFLLVVDDQKMNIPNSLLSWVASSAIPRFMKEMDRQCTISLKNENPSSSHY